MEAHIAYREREEIDTQKWNLCIDRAPNGLIYANSFYLDGMADNWSALVMGDYQFVMPLVWKRKYGIKYIYQPAFIQQLGVFGAGVEPAIAEAFIQRMVKLFRYIDTAINTAAMAPEAKSLSRINYSIPLNRPFSEISAQYSGECRTNINKSVQRGCLFTKEITIDGAIKLYRQAYGRHSTHVHDREYEKLRQLCEAALLHNRLIPCGVADRNTGKILFASLLFTCPRRIYYVLGAPTAEGRKARATYYFIDQVLQQFSGSELVFDFEGSDISSVAAFYQKFGPLSETYYHLHINRLPWPMNWLKQ